MTYSEWANRPSWQRPNLLRLLFLAVLAAVGITALSIARPFLSSANTAVPLPATVAAARWPLAFVPNAGQSDPAVHYQAHLPGGNLFFTTNGLTFSWAGEKEMQGGGSLGLVFIGADTAAAVSARDAQLGIVNYLLGNDPAGWQTGLPTYGLVAYEGLYPGISLAYQGQGSSLSAVFQLEPDTDPTQIRWQFSEAVSILNESGALQLVLDGESAVILSPPQAWQEVDGRNVAVTAEFSLDENGRVGLVLGEYDRGQPLAAATVIAFGSGPTETITAVAAGSDGRAYVTGYTDAAIFPHANPYQSNFGGDHDAFVTVYALDGQSLIYSTFLGGDGFDAGQDILVDENGRIYVVGNTWSADFPLVNPYQSTINSLSQAFVTIIAADGQSLIYSTYLGGGGDDIARGVALDENDNIYVNGITYSGNFPLANPYQSTHNGGFSDSFVTVFTPDGQSLVYSTYLGDDNQNWSHDIAVDANSRAFVVWDAGLPILQLESRSPEAGQDLVDSYLSVFAPDGQSLDYTIDLSGNSYDYVESVDVDAAGRAYVTGGTASTDFPVVNAYQPIHGGSGYDAFVTVVSPDGQSIVYSTFLGGVGAEWAKGIWVDDTGRAYVTGLVDSTNYPLVNPYQSTPGGQNDAFVTIFAPDGQSLEYSTFLGGNGLDEAAGIALDGSGRILVAGITDSADFPLFNPLQSYGDGQDGFVSVFTPDGQSLVYSTYLNGAYPDDPTSVDLADFGEGIQPTAAWLWLAGGLLILFVVGILVVRRWS